MSNSSPSHSSPRPPRRTLSRRARVVCLASTPLLALALSGCQSDSGSPAVATAQSAAPSSSAAADQMDWTAYDTYMRAFVKCLNDRGLDQVRYLGHNRRQEQELSGMPAESGNTVNPVVTQCGELVKPVDRPVLDPPGKPTEEELRKGRAFAACMRENGLPDYPDPDPDPANTDPGKGPDIWASLKTNPKFAPAQRRCAKELDTQPTGAVG